MSGAMQANMTALVQGQMTAGEAVLGVIIDTATATITAMAATAMASALAAHAYLPFVGIAIGAAAAAAVGALIKSQLAKVPGGGGGDVAVPSGGGGPAPMSVEEAKRAAENGSLPSQSAGSGGVSQAGVGSNDTTVININLESFLASEGDMAKASLKIGNELRKLEKRGYLALGRA